MFGNREGVLRDEVHQEIERSVSIGNNFQFTKLLLEARFETRLNNEDWICKSVEDYYVESLKRHWLQEAHKLITSHIRSSHITEIRDRLLALNTFSDCYNFIFGFGFIINEKVRLPSLLYTYTFLLKELSTSSSKLQYHEKQYVNEFKNECVHQLMSKAHDVQNEYSFFKSFLDFLKSSKNPEEVCRSLPIQGLENEVNFRRFLDVIIESHNPNILKVKKAAKEIANQIEFTFNKEIGDIISSYLKPTSVKQSKVDERHVLEVLGSHIVVSKVLNEVEKSLQYKQVEEVHFVSTVIHIDTDLSARIWHGRNIVVLAETAIISDDKPVTWNVSGEDAAPPDIRQAGTGDNGWGISGADGKDGESGGNVFIAVDELINGDNFNVTSNGGNGGKGQDGGNGENGKDGFYLKERLFKESFPPVSKFINSNKDANLNITKTNVLSNFKSLDECYAGSSSLSLRSKEDFEKFLYMQIKELKDFYFKVKCDNGCKITLSFFNGSWYNVCQSFLLHEGSPGEEGKPGGSGGEGGVEGFAGDIDIEVNNELYSNSTLSRANGEEGMPGSFGMSGIPGKKGADRAYKDYSLDFRWPKYVISHEKDNLKLHIKYSKDRTSTNVYTAYNDSYAEIGEKDNDMMCAVFQMACVNKDYKGRTMLDKLSQRKKTISKESIKNQYKQKLHKTGLFKYDNLIKKAKSLTEQSKLCDETIENEHITTEFKIIKQVSYSGKKRVNPHPLMNERNLTKTIDERPGDSLKKMSADELIELVKNDPSLPNWIKLLQTRLNLHQIISLWGKVASTKFLNDDSPSGEFNALEIGFCNKFQLAALEYFATKLDISDHHDCTSMSNNYSNNLLKLTDMSLKSFNKLFTITKKQQLDSSEVNQPLLRDFVANNEENRKHVLEQYLDLLNNPSNDMESFNAILVVFINECLYIHDNTLKLSQGVDDLIDIKQKRVSAKFDSFKSAIWNATLYNDLLKGVVEENNHSLIKFENEIRDDRFLFTVYNALVKRAKEQYVLEDVIKFDISEIDNLLSYCFLDCGPFSATYREFLARQHKTNILVYVINENNKVMMMYNHNPRATNTVHFLMKETTFEHLNVNNDFVEMLNDHHSKGKLFNDIHIYIDSLNVTEICDIVSKEPFMLDLNNDVCGDKSLTMRTKLKHIYMEDLNIKKVLEYYHLDADKELLSCRLQKLKLEYTGCSSIIDYLALHFENEGAHVSSKELMFVLNFVLKCTLNVPHVLPILTWIISAYSQTQWLVEIILLKMELNLQKTLHQPLKSKWREYLCVHNQKDILMLIMEKICEKDLNLSEKKFEETIYLLSKIPQNHLGLERVHLDEWKYYLKDKFWTQQLIKLGCWTEDNLRSASYYLMVLENVVGIEICEKLVVVLRTHETELSESSTIDKLPDIFRTIADKEVCLDEGLFKLFEECRISEWINQIKQKCFSTDEERSVFKLAEIIKNSSNTSKEVLMKLGSIAQSVHRCNHAIKTMDAYIKNKSELKTFISKLIDSEAKDTFFDRLKRNLQNLSITDDSFKDLGKSMIKIFFPHDTAISNSKSNEEKVNLLKDLESSSDLTQTYETLLAIVVMAIKIKHDKTLRDTQKTTILAMLHNERNVLCQVATGEGKSLIVVAVAIIKVLTGRQTVDIITSSRVLAMRDAEQYKDLYELFGILVCHNCSENIEERKIVYSDNSVVYGELSNFQRDFLLDRIHNHNIRGDRMFKTIIVDEVDSMLLDKGNNTLYLSHEIPGLDKLESVFIYIWKALHHIPAESGKLRFQQVVSVLKNKILDDLFGIITKEDLRYLDTRLGDREANETWHYLLKEKIIDDTGKVLKELEEDQLNGLPQKCIHKDHLKYLFQKVNERAKCLEVPNYLKQFVEKHLEEWILSGVRAMTMEPGVDYVVDIDRSESSCDRSPNIMIVDQDTGTDQVNSQWENGLHQFLQIKHGCRLSLITLKAVFISNVSFLLNYEFLYGLSGTLGSKMEREFLVELYGVLYVTIPTAKTKSFVEEVPIVCSNTAEWLETICNEVCKKTESRSVLIVCETVNDVKTLERKFIELSSAKKINYKQIHTYTRDYEELTIAKTLEPGHIIISTNLAGRGTDIKLTSQLIDAGGLHVCLSYLPGNSRIEEQAFGRAARNGEPGSGQMIVNSCANSSNSLKIIHLKCQRDVNETLRISDIKDYYNSQIKLEEECFRQFQVAYQSISKAEHPENIKSILLQTSLDQWAFWLEENKNCLNLENVEEFLNEIFKLKETAFSDWSNNVKDPFQMIKLGLVLIDAGEYGDSISLFERVIKEEPIFSESAYYYRLMAICKRDNIANKEMILDDLKLVSMKLKERLTSYSLRSFTIDYLKKKSPKAVLQIESFKEQQLNIAQIHDVLLQSIYKIVGFEISNEDFFYLSEKYDEIIAARVFSDLIEKGVITEPSINKNISDKDFRFAIEYGIDPKKITSYFKKYEKAAVNELKLLKDLKSEFCHLPSKERFWSMMILKNILTDEKQYCVVDLQNLKLVDPSLVNDVKSVKESDVKQGNEVWLYQPEECHPNDCAENFILLRREVLVEKIGEPKFGFLLNKSILYVNSLATLMLPKDDVEFEDFDCIRAEDFLKLGISLDIALNIIDELKEKQIIKNKQMAEGYMLLIHYSDIKHIELSSFKGYSDDVIQLLNFCFAFRIALQKMVDLIQNKAALSLPLPIRIHQNIIRHLFEHGIISKHAINPEKDISKTLADLYPEAMTKEEYYKLFDGLFDSSTNKEIVDELISKEFLTKKAVSWDKYVIGPKKLEKLTFQSSHSESLKDTIKLVLERQMSLGSDKTKNAIEQIIKGRSSMLYKTETPVFNVKPLYHELQQTKTPVSDCNIFSLNGFDQILVLEEKKWTMKMAIQTGGAALIGVSQIAVGVYMQFILLQPLLGAKVIQEGVSDIIYAVTCCFSGRFSWKQFGINKLISLIVAGCSMALTSLSKFKSMFGKSVSGASVLSSQKSECTSMLGKAANVIKRFVKPLSTETTVNKTVILKSLAKQVVTQSALGCSIGIAYGTIDNYLQPELVKLGEELVERCSVDIHDVASENLLDNIKQIYLLLGPKDAEREICMCYCNVLQECRSNSNNDFTVLLKRLFTIMDKESLSCFQELRNEVTPMNVCLLLTKLGTVLLKLREFLDSCSSFFSRNPIVPKIIGTFEKNLTKRLKDIKKTSSNHHSQSSSVPEPEIFADSILDDLKKEVKFVLVEKIKNNIINPLLNALNTTCAKYLSNVAAEKCFTLLKEEEVMELTKFNEEMYKTMEFGQVLHNEKKTFHQREYNHYLLEILERRNSLPVFREILENNYSIDRTCIELCCTIIPIALKQKGFNVPMLRVVVERNGVRRVYGGCKESKKDVLTVTISDDIENTIKENKILIRSLLDSVYKTMIEAYPEYRGFTSEALYRLVTHALENDLYVREVFRKFDTQTSTCVDNESNDDDSYTCFQKCRVDGNTHKDTSVNESIVSYMDVKQPANSESEIKDVKNTKDKKVLVFQSFKTALESINSHLHKTQPYLKFFRLTLEDFVETGHILIPSHDNIPGRFFDYYTSSYELVIPFFAQPGSDQYADYVVRMTLENKKHLNLDDSAASVDLNSKNHPHICYSVEPKDRLGRLDWGMRGSILLDIVCGDYVYTAQDCHSAGDLAQNEVEVLIFGDSMFRYISDYFPKVTFLTKHFPDKAPSKWKSNIIKTTQVCSKAQCMVLYFGNHAVKTKGHGDVFVRDMIALLTEIRSEMSNVKVILCEVLYPRLDPEYGFKRKVVNKINRINTDLEVFCKSQNVVFFRSNEFVDKNCLGKDWLHLNRKGYNNISKAILNQIKAST